MEERNIGSKSRWCWTTIDSISRITSGFAFKSKDFCEKGVPAVKISNIGYGEFLWKQQEFLPVEFIEEYQDFLVCPKDILLALTRPITNNTVKVCKYPIDAPIGLLNQRVAIIKPHKECVQQFLLYYFQSKFFKLLIENDISETLQPNLSPKKLSNFLLPLPPLLEQYAIVSKIEQLFSELDNGISNLKLAQEQLKVYRQAVLKKAFEGELTKKWREQQKDLPDTKDLLEQIRKEREKVVKNSGRKQKPIKLLTEEELAELSHVPEKWKWVKIGEVLEVFVGSTPSRKEPTFWGGDIPWVSSSEVAFCRINSTKESITKLGLEKSSTQIHPIGTVMLGMIGEGKTRGQVAILNINACHNQNTAAIRVNANYLSEFVYYFFEKNYNENRRIGSGNNQQALNKNIIENMSIALCSLPEQKAIVQEIETRLSVCDKIEQDIETNLEKAEALRQSILKKAFEGKLLNEKELAEVRGAEDWEPDEVLLEKIKAERARR